MEEMDDCMKIVDETGRVHDLSVATVRTMIGTGWGAFIAAWLLNIAFYKVQYTNSSSYITLYSCQVHPSAVDLEVSRFRNKMVINVLGEQKRIMKAAKEEGDYSDLITNFLILFLKTDKARLLCYVRSIKF